MTRIEPAPAVKDKPCILCAVTAAFVTNHSKKGVYSFEDIKFRLSKAKTDNDGRCTLKSANRFIRSVFYVRKYLYFKKADRVSLRTFAARFTYAGMSNVGYKAIVCVSGHYIYVDFARQKYWSFFDNLNDDVVAVWRLK